MLKVFVRGQGSVSLDKRDFVANGGEGRIYVKAGIAYKIYDDPARVISESKLAELEAIRDDRVIRPEALVLAHTHGPAIGYTMRHVADAWPLARLFARSFKEQHQITHETVRAVVRELAARIASVHAAGALVVDVSEMNFLVSPRFDAVFAIDVDSYQTPHHPAAAITPSIRDPRSIQSGFDRGSDWFSFAIMAAQLYVGVHPFKGKHPAGLGLEERMRRRLSFFDPDVRLPAVAYPLDAIPSRLRGWLEAVLQRGERSPPPDVFGIPTLGTAGPLPGGAVATTKLWSLPSPVRALWSASDALWMVCDDGLYRNAERVGPAPPAGAQVMVTPGMQRAVVASLDPALRLRLASGEVALEPPAGAEAMMQTGGRIYLKSGDKILELLLRDVAESAISSARLAASVLPHATKLFDGIAVQNLLGACYVSLFPESGVHRQAHIAELDDSEIIDARGDGNVALLLTRPRRRRGADRPKPERRRGADRPNTERRRGADRPNTERRHTGDDDYRRVVLRLQPHGAGYDFRAEPAAQAQLLSFVRLGTGVCVRLCEDDTLELFAADPRKTDVRHVAASAVFPPAGAGSALWHAHRGQLLCAAGNEVMRLSARAV